MLTRITFKRDLFLLLFVVACFIEFYAVANDVRDLEIFSRISRIAFLLLVYTYSVREVNRKFVFVLMSFLLSDVLFSVLSVNLYGMLGLVITRIGLINLTLSLTKKIEWKTFGLAMLFFTIVATVILSMFYVNTSFFYASIVTTLALIVLSSVTFMNVVKQNKKEDVLLFVASFLFIISDSVFGIQKFKLSGDFYLVMASVCYDIAFFLICMAVTFNGRKKQLLVVN